MLGRAIEKNRIPQHFSFIIKEKPPSASHTKNETLGGHIKCIVIIPTNF